MSSGKWCNYCKRLIPDPGTYDMHKYRVYWEDNLCYYCNNKLNNSPPNKKKEDEGAEHKAMLMQEKPEPHNNYLNNRYLIKNYLGTGYFGEVVLALDKTLEREVAIKTLKTEHLSNIRRIRDFEIEARIIASLNNPNIVNIYDFFDGQYIVMEYCPGGSLRNMLKGVKWRLSLIEATEVITSVLSALSEVHNQKIIHRDIKPENILFDKSNKAKVSDFGIAQLPTSNSDRSYYGTLPYMSPEQIMDKPVDQRSDIYSVGVVFYEILTGIHYLYNEAMGGESEIIRGILNVNPKAIERLSVDSEHNTIFNKKYNVNPILNKMMNKNPNLRFQNAMEALEAMEKLI